MAEITKRGSTTIRISLDRFIEDKQLYEKLISVILEDYKKQRCPIEMDVRFELPPIALGTTLCHPLYHLWKAVKSIHGDDGKINVLNFPGYDLDTLKAMELDTLPGFFMKKVKCSVFNSVQKKVNWNDGGGCAWGCLILFLLSIIVIFFLACAGGFNNYNYYDKYDNVPRYNTYPKYR
jgi:hypothetical protein